MSENLLDRIKSELDGAELSDYAMVPVVALSSGLLKGGKGRIGKSARNLAKKRNPVVTRYHRTHVVPEIAHDVFLDIAWSVVQLLQEFIKMFHHISFSTISNTNGLIIKRIHCIKPILFRNRCRLF